MMPAAKVKSVSTVESTLENRISDALAQRIGMQRFLTWFVNTVIKTSSGVVEIQFDSSFTRDYVRLNFGQAILGAIQEVLSRLTKVELCVEPNADDYDGERRILVMQPGLAYTRSSGSSVVTSAQSTQNLPQGFAVGSSNQAAWEAVGAVILYSLLNMLVLYGKNGVGKTRLLAELRIKYTYAFPERIVVQCGSEDFVRQFEQASRNHSSLEDFRRTMRSADLLILDDCHFFGDKEKIQEELLSTIHALLAQEKKVVLACAVYPGLDSGFCKSLSDLVLTGSVVCINPPDYQMRCDFLRMLSQRDNLPLSDDVVQWISKRVTRNFSDLEGAFARIILAQAKSETQQPDLALVMEILKESEEKSFRPPKPETILGVVAEYFYLRQPDLKSGRRFRRLSTARALAFYLIRTMTRCSFQEIGRELGGRNHSTVISACRRIERALGCSERLQWSDSTGDHDVPVREIVAQLEESIRAA